MMKTRPYGVIDPSTARGGASASENGHLAFASSYPPRRCGIATFTADLHRSFEGSEIVALAREGDPQPPWPIAHHVIRTGFPTDFERAAHSLADCDIEVVSVQHEYGIWGPHDGEGVLRFIGALGVPAIATLHTVLLRPDSSQRRIMEGILAAAAGTVVMSRSAAALLVDRYGAEPSRVHVIPHGVPDLPFVDPDSVKPSLGCEGRQVLLSFGLIGPGKGYEAVIEAMPMVVRAVSDAHYVIVGATHPDLLRSEGERYRESLKALAARLGVSDHVEFVDRFVGDVELQRWLQAADVFVTPYPNLDQIVSGTLSYALAAGKAIVSTPYLYATELLADGDGVLVRTATPAAMAAALIELLVDPEGRVTLARRAYRRGRSMLWPNVAEQYRRLFTQVRTTPRRVARISISSHTDGVRAEEGMPLPPAVRRHLDVLDTRLGIMQHAKGGRPDPAHGTCTDDVARALRVDLLHGAQLGWAAVEPSVARNLRYLQDAFDVASGRFRNLRRVDGTWIDAPRSEDADARALQALAETIADAGSDDIRSAATTLFERALPGVSLAGALRPRAAVVLACDTALCAGSDGASLELLRLVSDALWRTFAACETSVMWPWPEDIVTYENELPPLALIIAGRTLARPEMIRTGLAALDWLIDSQTSSGYLSVVGNAGWWPRDGRAARFDQQAISATTLLLAAEAAFNVTGADRYLSSTEMAYGWFLGRNVASQPVAVPEAGACRDGIGPLGVSRNQGAESTLMWLMAVEHMRAVRARVRASVGSRPLSVTRTA